MTVTAISANRTPIDPTERAVTGVNPLRARDRVRGLLRRELLTPADLVAPVLVQPDHRPADDYQHLPAPSRSPRWPRTSVICVRSGCAR